MALIEMNGIRRFYVMGDITVKAIRNADLSVEKGEFIAVMGPSGSGKSTLMNILGCLDKPTDGTYILDSTDTSSAGQDEFADIRNRKIGFVFQGFNLLAKTSALENVELPLLYNRSGNIRDPALLARKALETVGLGSRLTHLPSQLSGGQQQRVAIARALVTDPVFILADEPTGNLDTETTLEIMMLFQRLNRNGITIIMVTHEPEVACYVRRIITMRDGEIVADKAVEDIRDAGKDLEDWRKRNNHLYISSGEAVK